MKTSIQRIIIILCKDAPERHGWWQWAFQGIAEVKRLTGKVEGRQTRWREVNECGWISRRCCVRFVLPSEHDEVKQAAGGGQETKAEGQDHEEDHDVEIHGEQLKIDVVVGTEVTDRTDKWQAMCAQGIYSGYNS